MRPVVFASGADSSGSPGILAHQLAPCPTHPRAVAHKVVPESGVSGTAAETEKVISTGKHTGMEEGGDITEHGPVQTINELCSPM